MKTITKIKLLKEELRKHTHVECICEDYIRELMGLEHDLEEEQIALANGLEPELIGRKGGSTEPF